MSRSLDKFGMFYIVMIILAVLSKMIIPVVVAAGAFMG